MKRSSDELLAGQIAYYRQRAAEYDEWFLRQGRYDNGEQSNARWFDEVRLVSDVLDNTIKVGTGERILELACGTGFWTEQLCRFGAEITAVDASSEMIALNRDRVAAINAPQPSYVQADLFDWSPEEETAFDLVFFSFWLSHVPPDRFDAFWALVRRCLRPRGHCFFIDSLRSSTGSARDQIFRPPTEFAQPRSLNDGRRFEVVKIYYQPAELQRRLESLGFVARVQCTPTYFLHGTVKLAE